jgi:hypothetical protein
MKIACNHDCIWCCSDYRRHRCGGLLVIESKAARHEFEVFALDKALLAQFVKERHRRRLVPAGADHDGEAIDAARFLRPRAEGPRQRCSANKTDEFAPFHFHLAG